MEAEVQYNDYRGTTAADRSDLFIELPWKIDQIIIEKFGIPLDSENYRFIGVSVNTTDVKEAYVYFYFRNRMTNQVVKFCKDSVTLQSIFDLFKRFEFQIGEHFEDIDENEVEEIKKDE